MQQLKYPVYACLLLVFLSIGTYTIVKLSHSQIVTEKPTVTDVFPEETPNQPVSKGEQLFKQNCATCHSVTKDLIGPALLGAEDRGPWTDRKNLLKWVRNPSAFMEKDV